MKNPEPITEIIHPLTEKEVATDRATQMVDGQGP